MPTYNYKSRELIAKIVYYGPGRCGKTTNLQQVHAKMRPETKSELLSVATESDRTIYFDLLPLNLGTILGMKFMVRLFTVPGQIYYAETRKLVLKGADGIVFVADSQDHLLDENRQSLRDLKENLRANSIDYTSIPLVMQWNKRDLPQLVTEAELNATLNDRGVRAISAIAGNGQGVLETLRHITLEVFNHIKSGGKIANQPHAAAAGLSPDHIESRRDSELSRHQISSGNWSASTPKAQLPHQRNGGHMTTHSAAAPKEPPGPMRISADMIFDEFKNLAVMQSQIAERVTQLESAVDRLTDENNELRELLARR
ncbi:MAG: GTPase domain-containing protein [Myxococcales bacterium]|nr:GTPase domain-containing protein [Myxococcales bacterium]